MAEIEVFRARNTTGLAINGTRVTETKPYGLIQTTQKFKADDEEITKALRIDVQPVKHGKWEENHISLVKYIPEDEKEEGHSFYMAELKCSCCKRYNAVTFALTLNKPDFCQLCGARMDSDDDETM